MSTESEEVKQLFNDIINKMTFFERTIKSQDSLTQDVNKLIISFDVFRKTMSESVQNITSKIDSMDKDIREVRDVTHKVKELDLWKNRMDAVVTVNDVRDMKERFNNVSKLENTINNLQKELTEEIRKDIKDLEVKVTDSSMRERVTSLEVKLDNVIKKTLVTGGGAGAIIASIIAGIAAAYKAMNGQ